MDFDFKEVEKRVKKILNSSTKIEERNTIPSSENDFTFENGIQTCVWSIFIDIRKSTQYFKNNDPDIVSRVIRSFCSEVIEILRSDENYRE